MTLFKKPVCLLVFGIFLMINCKKSDQRENVYNPSLIIKTYLTHLSSKSQFHKKIDSTLKSIDFTSFVTKQRGHSVMYIFSDKKCEDQKFVFEMDLNMNVRSSNLVQIKSSNKQVSDDILNLYNGNYANFSGDFSIKTFSGLPIVSISSNSGRLIKYSKLTKGSKSNFRTRCTAYYLETTYYYSDGTTSTEKILLTTLCVNDSQTDETEDPNESGGEGSLGEEVKTVVTVDSVINLLTDSCKNAVFLKITNAKLKNFITHMYNSVFCGYNNIANLLIANTASILDANLNQVPADFHFDVANNTYVIRLNTHSDFANYSNEQWAGIIAHELMHAVRKRIVGNTSQLNDHWNFVQTAVDDISNMLNEIFGLNPADAIGLALNGCDGAFAAYPDLNSFSQLKYKMDLSAAKLIFNQFTNGLKGTKCP